jgi:hypothetical protein
MESIIPIAFTVEDNPKPVYQKSDIISYYISLEYTPLEAEDNFEKHWKNAETVIIISDVDLGKETPLLNMSTDDFFDISTLQKLEKLLDDLD